MSRRLVSLRLQGELVSLRLHSALDGEPAYALLHGQQEILRWLVWDGPASAGELAEYYGHGGRESESGRDLRLAIEERASGRLAGSISLRFGGHPGQGDLGYWLGLPFQGRGLGREAVALAAHLAFAHLGAQSLYAWVFVGNVASRRILERVGFTLARTVADRILKNGRKIDEWHFVLLGLEWQRAAFRPAEEALDWQAGGDENDQEPPARNGGSG